MSTPNFRTQRNFDLYVACYEQLSEEEIKQYEEETECEYDYESESYFFYEDLEDNFKYAMKSAEKNLNRELLFHKVELLSGYYDGVQMYVKLDEDKCDGWRHIEDMDNEDTRYLFDINRSTTLRKYESEKNFINKKLLPYLADNTGMRKLNCLGVFSNGEAIYQWADK